MLAEAGDGAVDDAGVVSVDGRIVDTQALGDGGPIGFEDDVGVLKELAGNRAALGRGQIEGDAALVGVDLIEIDAVLAIGRHVMPAGVADDRGFDLDDVGTQFRKHLRGPRARQQPAEVNDTDALQGQCLLGRHECDLRLDVRGTSLTADWARAPLADANQRRLPARGNSARLIQDGSVQVNRAWQHPDRPGH